RQERPCHDRLAADHAGAGLPDDPLDQGLGAGDRDNHQGASSRAAARSRGSSSASVSGHGSAVSVPTGSQAARKASSVQTTAPPVAGSRTIQSPAEATSEISRSISISIVGITAPPSPR